MRLIHLKIVVVIATLLCFGYTVPAQPVAADAVAILQTVNSSLHKSTAISYHYRRELFYYSENIQNDLSGDTYLSFDNAAATGFSYQVNASDYGSIYNGTELFYLDKKTNTMQVKTNVSKKYFSSVSYFYNSLLTLRNVLPLVLADSNIKKSIRDTILGNTSYHLIAFALQNKAFDYIDGFRQFTIEVTKVYHIIIDKTSLLPIHVIEKNNSNSDFTRTTVSNVNTQPERPSDLSWYYSSYQPAYKLQTAANNIQLVTTGATAVNWTLPVYNAGQKTDSLDLNGYKGKLVLLDFWIKNCGACQASFPHLQELQNEFATAAFGLLSVNAYDTKEDVAFFYRKHKPSYKMLYNGQAIAAQYGIAGYPTVVLIDKSGKVIYAGGFDQALLRKIIKEHL